MLIEFPQDQMMLPFLLSSAEWTTLESVIASTPFSCIEFDKCKKQDVALP